MASGSDEEDGAGLEENHHQVEMAATITTAEQSSKEDDPSSKNYDGKGSSKKQTNAKHKKNRRSNKQQADDEGAEEPLTIRRGVQRYLSDENIVKDLMLQTYLKEGGVPLQRVIDSFKKVKHVLAETVLEAAETIPDLKVVDGQRLSRRELSNEIAELIQRAPSLLDRRSVEVKNMPLLDTEAFKACGTVVHTTPDKVVFADEYSAIKAVETLNDSSNWRTGPRLALISGQTPAQARKSAGLPPLQHNNRETGRLAYLKPLKYGFIKPLKMAKSKDDNYFFLVSELNPRDTKLKVGDYLEYMPDLVVRDGEQKRQAKDVRKIDPPPARINKSPPPTPMSDEASPLVVSSNEPPAQRPPRLRTNLTKERERIAKGPDKDSIGFTRPRPSLSKLRVQAVDFVPTGLIYQFTHQQAVSPPAAEETF